MLNTENAPNALSNHYVSLLLQIAGRLRVVSQAIVACHPVDVAEAQLPHVGALFVGEFSFLLVVAEPARGDRVDGVSDEDGDHAAQDDEDDDGGFVDHCEWFGV